MSCIKMYAPSTLTSRHLILDLDSTLLFTTEQAEIYGAIYRYDLIDRLFRFTLTDSNANVPIGTGYTQHMWLSLRPGVRAFLRFARRYFRTISVWSAGEDRYVRTICGWLFADIPLARIYTRDKTNINNATGWITKPLDMFWRDFTDANPTNTLVIDDRSDTFSMNPENGILVPPYGDAKGRGSRYFETLINTPDNVFQKLQLWLMQDDILNSVDIQKEAKPNLFVP